MRGDGREIRMGKLSPERVYRFRGTPVASGYFRGNWAVPSKVDFSSMRGTLSSSR
jgi:hypothetical protein